MSGLLPVPSGAGRLSLAVVQETVEVDPYSLLGRSFDCACRKTHTVGVEQVLYGEDALDGLEGRLMRLRTTGRCLLVADGNTFRVAGAAVCERLKAAGWRVDVHLAAARGRGDLPACDVWSRRRAEAALSPACDCLVAVGSGVVSDVCKWVAHETGKPYVVVATAASMNGYASRNVAPSIDGVKRVVRGTEPTAIAALPSVLRDAPFELTCAGLGDVLAKPVSATDWRVSQFLFGEYFCPLCAELIAGLEPLYLERPAGLRTGDPVVLKALFEALVFSGVAMTLAETSAPASGGEHLVSHVLDMKAAAEGRRHDFHGRQVGVGTIFAAALYERLRAEDAPVFRDPGGGTDASYWGPLSGAVEDEHARKRALYPVVVARLAERGTWDGVREIVRRADVSAARIKSCLQAAGAAHRLCDIGCSRAEFVSAVNHCHEIRSRFTVVDLARIVGILPSHANGIVDQYLT
jgi:glycerol-1-phosphate dehydrogenase [NAD(P)+]